MVVYILNISPISIQNSPRGYSARHPISEHRESTTKDIKTRDIEIATHNTTSEHRMLVSQHIKTKDSESLNKSVCHILKLYADNPTDQLYSLESTEPM